LLERQLTQQLSLDATGFVAIGIFCCMSEYHCYTSTPAEQGIGTDMSWHSLYNIFIAFLTLNDIDFALIYIYIVRIGICFVRWWYNEPETKWNTIRWKLIIMPCQIKFKVRFYIRLLILKFCHMPKFKGHIDHRLSDLTYDDHVKYVV
jgi:hypothetical protein